MKNSHEDNAPSSRAPANKSDETLSKSSDQHGHSSAIKKSGISVQQKQLIACSLMHFVNDGLFYVIFFVVPLAALEFDLSFAQASLIKTCFTLFSSLLQYPCTLLTRWLSDVSLLALGTGWVSVGMVVMGLSTGIWFLWVTTIAAGLGGSAQHPVGSSLVSRLFSKQNRGKAIGTLNFGGDVGKAVFAVMMSILLTYVGWRQALYIVGALVAAFSVIWYLIVKGIDNQSVALEDKGGDLHQEDSKGSPVITDPAASEDDRQSRRQRQRFAMISVIGMLDNATRSTLLTFLPFLFLLKGLDKGQIGIYLTLVAVGGLFGKLGCGILADYIGNVKMIIVTELVTASLILLFIWCDPSLGLVLAAILGFFLNGTSSVIYSQAAGVIPVSLRTRGYGLFFTFTLSSAAAVPFLFGVMGDVFESHYNEWTGLLAIFIGMSAMTAMTIPITVIFHAKGRRPVSRSG